MTIFDEVFSSLGFGPSSEGFFYFKYYYYTCTMKALFSGLLVFAVCMIAHTSVATQHTDTKMKTTFMTESNSHFHTIVDFDYSPAMLAPAGIVVPYMVGKPFVHDCSVRNIERTFGRYLFPAPRNGFRWSC